MNSNGDSRIGERGYRIGTKSQRDVVPSGRGLLISASRSSREYSSTTSSSEERAWEYQLDLRAGAYAGTYMARDGCDMPLTFRFIHKCDGSGPLRCPRIYDVARTLLECKLNNYS